MSFTTPEAVSICATSTALMVPPLSALSRASTSAGRTARRMSPFSISTSTPMRRAFSPQPMAKRPLSSTRILSPLRQHVGERGFPGAVAVGDVDVGAALGVEHAGDVAQQAVGQRQQRAGIDVHGRAMHRPQHLVGHRGRPGNGQELTACTHAHSDVSSAPTGRAAEGSTIGDLSTGGGCLIGASTAARTDGQFGRAFCRSQLKARGLRACWTPCAKRGVDTGLLTRSLLLGPFHEIIDDARRKQPLRRRYDGPRSRPNDSNALALRGTSQP